MPQPDVLAAQITANRAAARATRARVIAFVTGSWFALGSWNVPDIERFIALVLPLVLAGQRTVASLTDSYLALLAAQALGGSVQPVGVPTDLVSGAVLRNGTDPTLVYRRPGAEVWKSLADGEPLSVAVEQGAKRLESIVSTDLQLAKTHTARAVLTQAAPAGLKATGYARTLQGDKSCGLCALASTRVYHRSDLMPIHPACDCDVAPLFGDQGLVIDPAEVDRIHALAQDFFGPGVDTMAASAGRHTKDRRANDFRDLVVVHQHGELGPVLAKAGDHFQGPTA